MGSLSRFYSFSIVPYFCSNEMNWLDALLLLPLLIGLIRGLMRGLITNETLVGSSEYSKFSHFYIPGANASGIADCVKYKGTITGILGQFRDNARYAHDKYDWSITPRNINIGNSNPLNDIVMFNTETGEEWIPKEYTAPKEKTTPAE